MGNLLIFSQNVSMILQTQNAIMGAYGARSFSEFDGNFHKWKSTPNDYSYWRDIKALISNL